MSFRRLKGELWKRTRKLLERMQANGHHPEAIDGKTYRCTHCGRYAVIHAEETSCTASGVMLKGKCAGSLRSSAR